MKQFKPMLAIDATDHLETIEYPKLASTKLDGIRCIFHPNLGMVSRSLKPIQSFALQSKFIHLIKYARDNNVILDGELYSNDLTFQEITRAVMTQNFNDLKTIIKLKKTMKFEDDEETLKYCNNLIDLIQYYQFEEICNNGNQHTDFIMRSQQMHLQVHKDKIILKQTVVRSAEEVKELFAKKLEEGYEGLILRSPTSPYKFGRSTLKEEFMLKVKPFETFDAEIISVIQATEVDPTAEKTINELGRSVTSKKKDDRILIEKASAFEVKYNGFPVKVSLAMTDEEKEDVWRRQHQYIGRMIEYKGMLVGAKDVPRHPVFVRFREDRDN